MKPVIKFFGIAFLLSLLFVSCLRDDEAKDSVRKVTVTVASETVLKPYLNYQSDGKNEREYILVTFGKNDIRHLLPTEINGFQHEKGFQYQLKIEEKTLAHPPMDGNDRRYSLIEILSKEKK